MQIASATRHAGAVIVLRVVRLERNSNARQLSAGAMLHQKFNLIVSGSIVQLLNRQ
jgi:hypothetical protein